MQHSNFVRSCSHALLDACGHCPSDCIPLCIAASGASSFSTQRSGSGRLLSSAPVGGGFSPSQVASAYDSNGALQSKQQYYSGWQETYSPPAFWEWPSSGSYLGGAGGTGAGPGPTQAATTSSSSARQRPLSAGVGPRRASLTTPQHRPAPHPSQYPGGGPTAAAATRTSTAPSGTSRGSFRSQQQAASSPWSPWTDGLSLGGGREGPGSPTVGRLIFGLPLSPRSQKKAAGLNGSAFRSAASSPSLAVSSTVSYFSRKGGPSLRDDPQDDIGLGGGHYSRDFSRTNAVSPAPSSPSAAHPGGFVGKPLQRIPKRTVSSSVREQQQQQPDHTKVAGAVADGVASAATSGGFAVRAMLHQQMLQQQGRGGSPARKVVSGGGAKQPSVMPFVVLDGEMVARAAATSVSPSGVPQALSVSGRKVQ